jgi:hypothetical protein
MVKSVMIRKTIGEPKLSDPLTRIEKLRRNAITLYGKDAFKNNERRVPIRKIIGSAQEARG